MRIKALSDIKLPSGGTLKAGLMTNVVPELGRQFITDKLAVEVDEQGNTLTASKKKAALKK